MRQLRRWTLYKVEPPKKHGLKPPKVPYQRNGQHASSINPNTWTDFASVADVPTGFDGINFAFQAGDGFFCIDLDHARNAETGEALPWAQDIIQKADTYTEISASGTGYHIIGRGTIPKNYKCGNIEIYNDKKFISVTGNVDDLRLSVEPRDLAWLIEQISDLKPESSGDASKDDFMLATRIARQLGCDPDKARTEFLKLATPRPKLQRGDYVERTIQKAIAVVKASAKPETESCIKAETLDNVKEKPLLWLWKNRIPKNKVTIFGGNPDAGKSLVSLDLTARLSKGRDFPDGETNDLGPVEVALLFCEDDAADTVKPRLIAAGADCSKVYRLFGSSIVADGSQKERHIAFDTDLHNLERFLLEHRAIRFLIVDPISSYLGEASMVKETDVRRVLIPLAELAARLEITVLLIAHLNKRSDVSALHKIMGAVAISGVARAAWMFAEDPENEDCYLMVRGKLNVGKKTDGLRYSIDEKEIPNCGKAPFINWEGSTDISAGQVLGLFGPMGSQSKPDKTADAGTWLKGFLSSGHKPAADVVAAAAREGIKDRTLKRAKSGLAVDSFKQGDTWWWRLPEAKEGCQIEDAPV